MIYKVLIIEDESGIRRRLASLIDWENLSCELCGQTDSGLSGLEYIVKHMPDIVISDIVMPNIDGLTLLRYIKERNYDIKFVILTGYKEFDYAKEALRLGAYQILTKPIDFDELRETIMEIVLKLNEHYVKALSQGMEADKSLPLKKSVEALFKGHYVNESQINIVANALNIQCKYAVLCLRLIDFFEVSHYDEAYNTLCEVAGQCLTDRRLCCVPINHEFVGILLPDWLFDEASEENLFTYVKDFYIRIASNFRHSFSIGISRISNNFMAIFQTFNEACKAAREIFYIGQNGINPYRGNYDEMALECMSVDEFLISLDTIPMDSSEIMSRIRKLWEDQEPYPSPTSLKSFLIRAIFKLQYRNRLSDKHLFASYSSGNDVVSQIINSASASSLCEIFYENYKIICRFIKLRKSGDRENLICSAVSFIEKNFTQDIMLKDVADHVFISPAYLSNLIKQATGQNFIDILNHLRISMATRLLQEGGMKVYEVAEKVGFNDVRHFSQTFKNITGQSPSEIKSK